MEFDDESEGADGWLKFVRLQENFQNRWRRKGRNPRRRLSTTVSIFVVLLMLIITHLRYLVVFPCRSIRGSLFGTIHHGIVQIDCTKWRTVAFPIDDGTHSVDQFPGK